MTINVLYLIWLIYSDIKQIWCTQQVPSQPRNRGAEKVVVLCAEVVTRLAERPLLIIVLVEIAALTP